MSGFVVGVDGSDQSRRALDWAIGEAALHGAPLEVVAVHAVAIDSWGLGPMHMPIDEKAREQVRAAAEQMVDKAMALAGDNRPTSVRVSAVSGIPAEVLVNASRDADMLVLGSRGAGGFALLRLGSVTTQVIHHAECAVTVVPWERDR